MRYGFLIGTGVIALVTSGFAHEVKKPTINSPVSIEMIDSDTLVGQFWLANPSPVEAIVLKRKQRAKK